MKNKDRAQWMEKNMRLNQSIILAVGTSVLDDQGRPGIVEEINLWSGDLTDENHGSVQVRFDNDYIEHYTVTGWHPFLRLVETHDTKS